MSGKADSVPGAASPLIGAAADSTLRLDVPPAQLEVIEAAKKSMAPSAARFPVVEHGRSTVLDVVRAGVGPLLTASGTFHHFEFRVSDVWQKYVVLVRAELDSDFRPIYRQDALLLRIDSGCKTGQLFGDLTCDCREQLERSLAIVADAGEGLVINIPGQDGRGLGLPFKLAMLKLQSDLGVDTVEASALLDPAGRTADQRTYAGVIAILKFFGCPADLPIRLMSNNPKKLTVFHENGFVDCELSGIVVPPTEHTLKHLLAKQRHLGHVGLVHEPSPDTRLSERRRRAGGNGRKDVARLR